jgi:hypothetical protein
MLSSRLTNVQMAKTTVPEKLFVLTPKTRSNVNVHQITSLMSHRTQSIVLDDAVYAFKTNALKTNINALHTRIVLILPSLIM